MKVKLEDVHFIPNIFTPQDLDGFAGNPSPVIVLMQNFDQALIFVQLALPKVAGVITVNSCLDITPTVSTAIMFPYYRYETSSILANGDVHGARTWTTTAAAGLIPVATGVPSCYIIEIKAAMLLANHIGFRVCMADPAAASIGCVSVLLSGGRYQDANVTSMAVV